MKCNVLDSVKKHCTIKIRNKHNRFGRMYKHITLVYTKHKANLHYYSDKDLLQDKYKTIFRERIQSANGKVYVILKDNYI